jgi:Lysylphosphatidylglycerol synthase TM region
VEAGLSAVSGVIVFAVSLVWVHGVNAPLWPLLIFGAVLAVLLHPRVFQPLAARVLRRFGTELPELPDSLVLGLLAYYAFTWIVGGTALWLLVRSVGANPPASAIVFLGGVSAVGAIVAVLAIILPSGLGVREASMYGLIVAIAPKGAALGATVLNRLAITVVEIALLLVGGADGDRPERAAHRRLGGAAPHVRPRREVEDVGAARERVVAEREAPEAVDRDRLPVPSAQRPRVGPAAVALAERVDPPVAEVTD